MTILRKLLLTGAFIATGMTHAVSMKGFDINLLNPYIQRAHMSFASIVYRHGDSRIDASTIVKDKKFYKNLYKIQKAALKVILKELKHAAEDLKKSDKALWLPARQLYKAFKHGIYRNWKKTGFLLGEQTNGTIILE